jgi:hypothetical protein
MLQGGLWESEVDQRVQRDALLARDGLREILVSKFTCA